MVRKKCFFELLIAALAYLSVTLLVGCSTPKMVEEHHYHSYEIDTAAVQAIVDGRLGGWHEEMTQAIKVAIQSQQTEQSSQEQEKERVTETITTWVDSLGREMRQEQRTTERDISRQQRLWEQRMSQQYEERLQRIADSLDAAWQARMDATYTHWAQADSSSVSAKPTPADNRPWWQRWLDALKWIIVGAVVLGVALAVWRARR